MNSLMARFASVTIFLAIGLIHAKETADIIVAADGSGSYKTIMAAIQSIPKTNKSYVTILVKNGTYNEHICIDRSFIAIVGEDRVKTIISYSLNRDDWEASKGTTAGSGVIDIGVSSADEKSSATATDIIIANLTVQNTYNSTGVKTHVIRGEGGCNRVSVIGCNVWCKGHDTIALWNSSSGMYYHADCSFKGSIDAVCPRGWCYAVGCGFFEGTSSSPLWHEIASGSTQKFVIRTGALDTIAGNTSSFRLLNENNSSSNGTRYFLLDCMISHKASTKGNYTEAYFYNCHGEKTDQSWYANNLASYTGSPKQEQITAAWTFDSKWDPENTLPGVLPASSLPQPWDKAYDVSSTVKLSWLKGRNATESALYFGSANPPPFLTATAERTYSPGKLASGTYYWRVDAIDGSDTVKGPVWTFKTVGGISVQQPWASGTFHERFPHIRQKNGEIVLSWPHNWENKTEGFHSGARTLDFFLTDLSGKEIMSIRNITTKAGENVVHCGKVPRGVYAASIKSGLQTVWMKVIP
jgi:pectinesterase